MPLAPYSIPNDVRLAGPLDRPAPDPPLAWDDHAIEAEEELRAARRLYRDEPCVQRKLVRECIDRAEEAIQAARRLLA